MTTPDAPRSLRAALLPGLAGLLAVLLLALGALSWWSQRAQQASRQPQQVIEQALWLRAELHALAAAELAWRWHGQPDALQRAQRQQDALQRAAGRLVELNGESPHDHAQQLRTLLEASLEELHAAWLEAQRVGPALNGRGGAPISDRLPRVDSLVSALHADAERQLQDAEQAAAQRALLAAFLLLLALPLLLLCIAILHFEARARARADDARELARRDGEQQRRRAEQHAHDLQRLGELADQLRPTKTLEETSEVLAAAMRHVLPQFHGALYLQVPGRSLLRRQVGWGKPSSPLEDMFTPDDCWAVRRGAAYPTEPHAPPCHHLAAGSDPAHVLCVPLCALGETVGSLHFSGEVSPSSQDRRIAQLIADQLAQAVLNLRLQESLRVQSTRDPLTGLFHRRYIEASLMRECLRARRSQQTCAALLLDLDDFKAFNEKHSHEAGDAALAQIAGVIGHSVRPEDHAGRYGGEKFLVVLPDTDLATARDRAELLRRAVRATPIDLHGRRVEALTCSIGLAVFPLHGSEPGLCLRAADKAVAAAKAAGRDRVEVAEPTAATGKAGG